MAPNAAPGRPPSASVPVVERSWRPAPVHLALMLGMVAVVTAIYEIALSASPVPPGSDPGDWIQRSYAFVGQPHPPVLAVGSPYLYPPLIFPIVGGVYLLTGSATTTGYVVAGVLLAGYGLTVVRLARRFLTTGPTQVAFVGVALFNGTTLSMLFWGAYPNFLAFILFNEAILAFAAYTAKGRPVDGLVLFALLSLEYLAHSLTFDLLVFALAVAFFLLWAAKRVDLKLLVRRPTLLGAGLLLGTIAAYTAAIKFYSIPTPNYLSANPASYVIDNLGELFVPLANAPSLYLSGPPLVLAPLAVLLLLTLAAVVLVVGGAYVGLRWRRFSPNSLLLTEGWLVAALLTPVVGWIAHVDTDYPRFLYFLPLPGFLFVALALEQLLFRAGRAVDPGPTPRPVETATPTTRSADRRQASGTVALVAALTIVVVLAGNVAVPTIFLNEKLNTGTSHNAYFVDAASWLRSNPTSGSVLTVDRAIRWTEALTDRGGYDVGPTWLLFEPWQVLDSEETYWALNSRSAITNNEAVLSYSGFGSPLLSQAPMYSVIDEGVTVSLLRALPGGSFVTSTVGNSTVQQALTAASTPTLTVPGPQGLSGVTVYSGGSFQVTQTATLPTPGGEAWINYSVTPVGGAQLRQLVVTLADPPRQVALINTGGSPSVNTSGGVLYWNVSSLLGRLPGNQPIDTVGTMTPAPASATFRPSGVGSTLQLAFNDPNGGGPFSVSLHLTTPSASNPAVVLPSYLDTVGFLTTHDIHFLLLPNVPSSAVTVAYYESVYDYQVGYTNPDWQILEG
ncbi:MAG: hypothetical protein L3K23_02715 [Thermoplasmata archaeon]|nr:hypothetical protein [Thermoplasmata archaeon]